MGKEKVKTERNQEIIKRCIAGETYAAVAREFGVSTERVRQIYYKFIFKQPINERGKYRRRQRKDA